MFFRDFRHERRGSKSLGELGEAILEQSLGAEIGAEIGAESKKTRELRFRTTRALVCSILLAGLFFFSSLSAHAQFNDPITLQMQRYDVEGNTSLDAVVGAPPIRRGDFFWTNVLTHRRPLLEIQGEVNGQSLRTTSKVTPTNTSWTGIFRYKWSDRWSGSALLTLAERNLGRNLDFRREARFLTGFLNFTHPLGESGEWRWLWGIGILDASAGIPAVPGVGLEYENTSRTQSLRLGFPAIIYSFTSSPESWRVGAQLQFEGASYHIGEEWTELRSLGVSYLAMQRLIAAGFYRRHIGGGTWITATVGATQWSSMRLLDDQFKERSLVGRPRGPYLSVTLAQRFGN